MKFQTQILVIGMKGSKGTMDGGQAYDSTTVYSQTDLDGSKGTAKGFGGVEYKFGEASNFDKYKHLTFPFTAQATLEIVTNGKTQKAVILDLKPLESPAAGSKTAA